MLVNSVTPVSFKAHVPQKVRDVMFDEANKCGRGYCNILFDKNKEVTRWGHDSSIVTIFEEKGKDGVITRTLGLVNGLMAPLKRAILPNKESLLDSYLSLKERDVEVAENKLGF